MLLGGVMEQPRLMYEGFIDVAKKHLFRRAINPQNIRLLVSGDAHVEGTEDERKIRTETKGQHLTCFTGGMVGIAARIFDRPRDVDVAIQLTDSCVWSYNATASGIGPEIYNFVSCGSVDDSQTGEKCIYSEKKWIDGVRASWDPPKSGETDEERKSGEASAREIIKSKRLPPGMTDVGDRKYILRPEAIESVFMMYRITGDASWMDKAWGMFSQIEKHTRTKIGAASLEDITKSDPTKVNSMESFWLAETLKYFYLIFADWDTVNLDQWVLNTEAHPLRRPYT
jgi:hypothetical protein